MGSRGYKKPFTVSKIVIDFFLGAGLSACWSFYSQQDIAMEVLIKNAILCGIAATILIEGGRYIYKYFKKGRRKKNRKHRSQENRIKNKAKISW